MHAPLGSPDTGRSRDEDISQRNTDVGLFAHSIRIRANRGSFFLSASRLTHCCAKSAPLPELSSTLNLDEEYRCG